MLLAVDTSTRMIGIALHDGSNVVGEFIWHSKNYHTVELAPAVQQLLSRCSVRAGQLTGLGVALGPGSFTGLRIGMALVKGMAQGLNIPTAGIPTLDFLAETQPPTDLPLIAVLQAGRQRLAVGEYKYKEKHWIAVQPNRVMTVETLSETIRQPTVVCGEMSKEQQKVLTRKYRNVRLVPPAMAVRRPSMLAEMALERINKSDRGETAVLAPIYLHTGKEIAD